MMVTMIQISLIYISPFAAFSIKAWHDFTTLKQQSATLSDRFFSYDRKFVLSSVQNRSICQQAAPFSGDGPPVWMKKMMKIERMSVYFAASPSGKMILFTKKKITIEMPPLSTVVPML